MEIGKYYYVVTRNNQMATGSVVSLYADWEVIEKTIETTTDITKVRLYEDCDDALNFAEQYNLEVKKVRTDILGLGSRWNENTQNPTNHYPIRTKQICYEWNYY